MKRKTVTPEHKLIQAILERKKRYQVMVLRMRKFDVESEAQLIQIANMEALVKELDHLLFLYGAYVSEASNHGDCMPVTSQTVMNLE